MIIWFSFTDGIERLNFALDALFDAEGADCPNIMMRCMLWWDVCCVVCGVLYMGRIDVNMWWLSTLHSMWRDDDGSAKLKKVFSSSTHFFLYVSSVEYIC